ncbi:hypothetical protein GF339_05375 [candidate division KSB3 bacterium]|uniref:Uncharacterized protein n=1 Tax=candidate division KSB3 bacterium TaxID=2044937 RepID=A0A9D5JTM2_9BACT|nr:hypothetical protein [candidate division KSB3 bacterium]MBD3323993.1 hypothetical protein [candidate division KSB3 bacterium]
MITIRPGIKNDLYVDVAREGHPDIATSVSLDSNTVTVTAQRNLSPAETREFADALRIAADIAENQLVISKEYLKFSASDPS